MTDEELYSAMGTERKEVAFRALYDRHSGPLFRFIYRFTVNSQAAEEILHDIFIQLLSEKFHLDSGANLKGWLYTLAKNKSLNHIKKTSFEKPDEIAVESAIAEDTFEQQFDLNRSLQKLAALEASLPTDLMHTWKLRKQGLDYQQIADKLSIPVGTVKSRFSRLVEHLKKEFVK